jgi:hypothetical protein
MSIEFGVVNDASKQGLPRQIAIGARLFSSFLDEVKSDDYNGDIKVVETETGRFKVGSKETERSDNSVNKVVEKRQESKVKDREATSFKELTEEKPIKLENKKKTSVIPQFYAYHIMPLELQRLSGRTFDSIKSFLRDAAMQVEKIKAEKRYHFRFKECIPLEISISEDQGTLNIVVYAKGDLKDELTGNLKKLLMSLQQHMQRESIDIRVVDLSAKEDGQDANKDGRGRARIEYFEEDKEEDVGDFKSTLAESL